jgi:hypothetical protein
MKCKGCQKELTGGGFRCKDNETQYLCYECAVLDHNIDSLKSTLELLLSRANETGNTETYGRRYKTSAQEAKKRLREIAHLIEFTLNKNDLFKKRKP